ncbi:MAG: VirB3 family type IV secretion system protein [Cetobacterium sp.]
MKNNKVPVCQGLIKTETIMGISREAFIMNSTLGAMFLLGFRQPYLLIINLFIHFGLKLISRRDPLIIKIFFKRYLKQNEYFNGE